MLIRILGSAAGGGFPQWNCGCPNCAGARSGALPTAARTQESVALSQDGSAWFLLNASPEIRQQIESCPALHPRAPRDTPIRGIVLTNGDLDHCLGLLSMRESEPLVVYSTERVRQGFTINNVLYRTLERFPGQVTWRTLRLGEEQPLWLGEGRESGLRITAFPAPGKLPIHLGDLEPSDEDNVGVCIRDASGRKLAYFPAVARMASSVERGLTGADAIFFDGTFWSSDELGTLGVGEKKAEDMAHWPVGGPHGSLAMLGELSTRHRVLIHVNNTNPILCDDSKERALVAQNGVVVAFDGMELSL